MTKLGVALAGLLVALVAALATLAPQAQATTRTVHLSNDGPRPASLTLAPGDRVVFVNDDVVPHEVTSQTGWQYDSGPLPPGQRSSATPALTAPGTYGYVDSRGIVFLPQTFHGRLVVPAPRPQPSPTHSPRPRPTSSPQPSPTRSPGASPTASPAASPTASPAPSPTVAPTSSPQPSPSAPPSAGPSSSPPPPDLEYGGPQALVQPSPHRYGLPALLAAVAIGGVLSLLARYLLWLPDGRGSGPG